VLAAVIAHGKHVADVVPSGELDRLRETIKVLSDPEAVQALADTEPVVFGRDGIIRRIVNNSPRWACQVDLLRAVDVSLRVGLHCGCRGARLAWLCGAVTGW
jgi:hypothetical protein